MEIIKHYKYFVNPKYSLCRQCIAFLFQSHGIIYFGSSFWVELIKKDVISKDVTATISNFLIIPIFFLTTLLRKKWADLNLIHKRTRIIFITRLSIMMILFFSGTINNTIIYPLVIILELLGSSQFFLNSMICNNFAESQFAGMYVTMMASFTNFGHNSSLQLKIIG